MPGSYDFSVRSSTLIKKMGWMNVEERHKYFTLILMYKCLKNLTSDTISNLFCKPVSVHNHSTRFASADNLYVLKPRTNYLKRSISYKGVQLRNNLPCVMKKQYTYFKSLCKNHIPNK